MIKVFIFGNIFISLCAYSLVIETYNLSAIAIDHTYSFFVFFSTLFLYNAQRIFFAPHYFSETNSERHHWIAENLNIVKRIAGLALLGLMITAFQMSFKQLLILSSTGLISFFYFFPVINLRSIPGLKAVMVAIIWVLVTAVYPLIFVNENLNLFSINYHSMFICLERFLFFLPLCIIFDIRDLKFDAESGIKTLPFVVGIKITKQICYILLLLFVAVSFRNGISLMSLSMLLSAVVTSYFIRSANEESDEYIYSFYIDGMIFFQAALIFIATSL